ncbi:hypothetical protein [Haloferula sp. BvORR071]|uniref:hypothetical protein n=1 Tax=Haloferula sp. BvORR071 TaxID=1396141 RepID=UPI0022410008|nr:hypothetical protein [Haloferula sp. BvORR071]
MKSAPNAKRSKLLYAGLALLILTAAAGVPLALKWKEGNDRAACIMNQRNVQQAYRAYSCVNGTIGEPVDKSEIIGKYLNEPHCPSGGTYLWCSKMPPLGTLAAPCSDPKHALPPEVIKDW